MSYFAGCFKTDRDVCAALDGIIAAIAPAHLGSDPLRIGTSPYLATFGHKKSIKHLVVKDRLSESWLAILGTPLVRLPTEVEEQTFLARFLTDPRTSLRE